MRKLTILGLVVCLFLQNGVRAQLEVSKETRELIHEALDAGSRGRFPESLRRLQAAEAACPPDSPSRRSDRAELLVSQILLAIQAESDDSIFGAFGRLSRLASEDPFQSSRLRRGYAAIWEAVRFRESARLLTSLERCRSILSHDRHDRLASDLLHDLAFGLAAQQHLETAAALYRSCLTERVASGDRLGATWSRNNLADVLLRLDRPLEAMEPIAEAFRAIHESGIEEPRRLVAFNLTRLLRSMSATPGEPPSPTVADFAWNLFTVSAQTARPRNLPPSTLLEFALDFDAGALRIERLLKLRLRDLPPEMWPALLAVAARKTHAPPALLMLSAELERLSPARFNAFGDAHQRAAKLLVDLRLQRGLAVDRAFHGLIRSIETATAEPLAPIIADLRTELRLAGRDDLAEGLTFRQEPSRDGPRVAAGRAPATALREGASDVLASIELDEGVLVFRDHLADQRHRFENDQLPAELVIQGLRYRFAPVAIQLRSTNALLAPPFLPVPTHGRLEFLSDGAFRYQRR
ncbi:MAG: hypothetical protein KDB53_14000 [Planctomycetes bacterium]|nr:hypothetical protein [Planctomycetota bacterium]